jgi:MFS family permease
MTAMLYSGMRRVNAHADRIGRPRVMIAGLGLLIVGSTLGVQIHGVAGFIAGLPLQALGSAAYATAALSLIKPRSAVPYVAAVAARVRIRATLYAAVRRAYGAMFVRTSALWLILPYVANVKCGMGAALVSALLTAGATANVLGFASVLPLSRRYGRIVPATAGSAMVVAGTALLHATCAPDAWIAALLIGAGGGLSMPMFSVLAADLSSAERTGSAGARVRSSTDIALMTAPAIIGTLLGRGNLEWALALSIGVMMLCLGSACVAGSAQRKRDCSRATAA